MLPCACLCPDSSSRVVGRIKGGKSSDFCLDTLYGKMTDFFSTAMFLAKVSRDFSVYFHIYPVNYTPFSSPHFPDLTISGYPHKASFFEYRLRQKYLVAKIEPEL